MNPPSYCFDSSGTATPGCTNANGSQGKLDRSRGTRFLVNRVGLIACIRYLTGDEYGTKWHLIRPHSLGRWLRFVPRSNV